MTKNWRPVLVGVLALALLGGGLVTGWALSAQAGPGDAEDPLVAKSYVDQLVKEQTVSLHNQIVVLNQRIEVLQKALAETGKQVNLPAMPADYQNVVWTVTTPATGTGNSGGVNQPAPPAAETKQTAMVTPASGANVRYGPGQDFTVIAVAACGDRVTVLDSAAGPGGEKWCKIRLADGREGYIRADLLYY